MKTINVLGINIACVDQHKILNLVDSWLNHPNKHTILYVNAHCLNIAYKNPTYQTHLHQADLVYPDGISVVWAAQLLAGHSSMRKSTGADWIAQFCELAVARNLRIYILGGKPNIAKKAKEILLKTWPTLNIVGAYDGFFAEKSENAILQDIAQSKPDVLFVGMGTPTQEKWIAKHRSQLPVSIFWAVGALFDYVAGEEQRVPYWLNILHLEWFWRFLLDPGGKWYRYLIGNPLFVSRVLFQWLRQIFKKKL